MAATLQQFIDNVVKSGLMSADEVSSFQQKLPPDKGPDDVHSLAKELVFAGKLTKYQAQMVYQGKPKGLVFGEYTVLDKLGQGGMGVVLKAQHRRMKRMVAVKVLPTSAMKSPEAVKRFYREAEAAARLNHPNIVTAFDASEHDGTHYLVMEFVDGQDLGKVLSEHGRMPVRLAVEYVLQAARGLAYAHAEGVIHRDIKPANLLVDKNGTVKILDMGLARMTGAAAAFSGPSDHLTRSGEVMGTCDYMAPEQAENTHSADHRADIYSLGCTFYRLLTAEPLYTGESLIQVLLAHREAPIPSLCAKQPDVPAALETIFQRMVAKRPEERYGSMQEVILDLEGYLSGAGPAPPLPSPAWELSGDAALAQNLSFLEQPTPGPGTLRTQRHVAVRESEPLRGHVPEDTGRKLAAQVKSAVASARKKPLVMYSEVCPLLPFPFFNVCCDETYGLGTGPSKELAQKIGVGGVYVRHIRRIHDLLTEKHKKRMMMWGDIILEHPKNLEEIPKDTIMLTWAYDPRANFESQIIPFAKSGYEFFVCPGVGNWSRILPDFDYAMTNIGNFVRDGAKHGAIGMLNTDWEDDGEALNGAKWHADAWAAECSWNASKTKREDFERRVGAVLFGEKGDRFGQAVELLAKTHRMAGMEGMNNRRFWQNDFSPRRDPKAIRASAERLLAVVRPAIEHLEACRREAVVNQHVLDVLLFGARRMEFIGQRMLDGLEAARLYTQAYDGPAPEASPKIAQAEAFVRANREALDRFGREFAALWLKESKPYALDRTTQRYAAAIAWYDGLLKKLANARKRLDERKPLPRPEDVGLVLPEAFPRYVRPRDVIAAPLTPETPWADATATHRLGLVVRAGPVDRFDLPVEVAVTIPEGVAQKPVRAFCSLPGGQPQEIPAQVDPGRMGLRPVQRVQDGSESHPTKPRLVLLIPGPLPKGSQAAIHVYLGSREQPKPLARAVATKDAPKGMKWIENDEVRLLLGSEGAHVYRWEVKSPAGRDLTEPGETGWAGFSDAGMDHRGIQHALTCTAQGPALVRYQCSAPTGQVKTISLYAGCSWMEVVLSEPVSYYWDFDDPKNFAAEFSTPGKYLFSTGATGPVGKHADGVPAQVKAAGAHWGIKFNDQKLALGMAIPETAVSMCIAPGSGAGGVGIEGSVPASHFITFGGMLDCAPQETMTRLQQTLDFRNPPEVVVHSVETATR
jgi:serine/threonine protein kinase